MALFAVVIFPSGRGTDLLQKLHELVYPDAPCQIIAQTLYLIECDKGAPEIAWVLGQRDPADSDLPFAIENLDGGLLEDMMGMFEGGDRLKNFPCPIPGCQTVFPGYPNGWDGHVGSPRLHPDWHPELSTPEERRAQFKREFATWFRV